MNILGITNMTVCADSKPSCSVIMTDTTSGTTSVEVGCEVTYRGNISPVVECSPDIIGEVSLTDDPFHSLHYVKRVHNNEGPFTCTIQFTRLSTVRVLIPPSVGLPDYVYNWTSGIIHESRDREPRNDGKFKLVTLSARLT